MDDLKPEILTKFGRAYLSFVHCYVLLRMNEGRLCRLSFAKGMHLRYFALRSFVKKTKPCGSSFFMTWP